MFAVLYFLPIALLLVTIVAMIVRAVRATRATIAESGLYGPGSKSEDVEATIRRIRAMDVRCPRCGEQAFALLGRGGRWTCESDPCRLEFEGPGSSGLKG